MPKRGQYLIWLVGLMVVVACGRVSIPPPSPVENTAVAAAVTSTPSSPCARQTVADEYHHYSFEVPISFEKNPDATADLIVFTNDATRQLPSSCHPLVNAIKLDFYAQPPGNFAVSGQAPEDGVPPDLGDYILISGTNYPTWIKSTEAGEGADLSASSKQIYIQGNTFWYFFSLYCVPDWTEECETVLDQTIASFTIR